MIVLFDGTASKPWNRMISAEQSSQIAYAPPLPSSNRGGTWNGTTDRIRAYAKRCDWFTSGDCAKALQLKSSQVAGVLNHLSTLGELTCDRSRKPFQYRWS